MKGVNKLIVEIKDTDSEYFDRAILFLKPEKLGARQSELNESAEKLLERVKDGTPRSTIDRRLWISIAIAALLSVLAVLAILL